MPFQDLVRGFQGVNEHGVPIAVNPGRLNFDPTQVRVNDRGGVTQRVIVGGSEGSFRAIEDGPHGTAKTISGAPRAAADLRADDIIDLGNGMKTTVAAAERIGAIRRGPAAVIRVGRLTFTIEEAVRLGVLTLDGRFSHYRAEVLLHSTPEPGAWVRPHQAAAAPGRPR